MIARILGDTWAVSQQEVELAKQGYAALNKALRTGEFQSFPLQAVGLGERAEPPVR
jgi:hypothetical protein